jgi:hypothetical protein
MSTIVTEALTRTCRCRRAQAKVGGQSSRRRSRSVDGSFVFRVRYALYRSSSSDSVASSLIYRVLRTTQSGKAKVRRVPRDPVSNKPILPINAKGGTCSTNYCLLFSFSFLNLFSVFGIGCCTAIQSACYRSWHDYPESSRLSQPEIHLAGKFSILRWLCFVRAQRRHLHNKRDTDTRDRTKVGFRSVRELPSYLDPTRQKMTQYVSQIVDGDDRPLYRCVVLLILF